jgi:hypothetical protein
VDGNIDYQKSFRIWSGLSGVTGVVLLIVSFAINNGPPPNLTAAELLKWSQENYAKGIWGAWLQAVGPVLIVLFAFALVHLAGATGRLAGWMTFFGATILTTVSLIEITFYFTAWSHDPSLMPSISLRLISAVQHLYFVVAAPALFLPLGLVLVGARVLPRLFGYLAILLAVIFSGLGIKFLLYSVLPPFVQAFASVQALWWLAAAITLIFGGERIEKVRGVPHESD